MRLLFVQDAVRTHPLPRLLRLLGIDFTVAYFTGDLQTPTGNLAWNNDAAIRNYLKQFDAVLVGIRGNVLSGTHPIMRSFRWLGWNDPDDPPVAYVGVDPRAGYTDINATMPSDFPIVRPNASDPAGTLVAFTTGSYAFTTGLRVRLARENNTELYTNCAVVQASSNFALNDGYLYRLDLSLHNALGAQGEILARPVSEDLSFPADAVCAYRYKKRFLLPMTLYSNTLDQQAPLRGMFWTLYALKLLGVPAPYQLPFFMVMDDALMLYDPPTGNPAGLPTYEQFARIGYETYRYWAETFYPRTGCAMVCGLLTGGRYRPVNYGEHWKLVNLQQWLGGGISAAARQWITQWHQALLQHHHKGLPCTIHDHTISPWANRAFTNFVRHTDAGYAHAAPNDVPITRGATLVKASTYPATPPTGARERLVDGELYYEWGFTTSGAGATISSLTPNNRYGARVLYETAAAEMRALGFPDAHGGDDYRLLITPEGHTGDPSVWQVWQELGYQLVRNRIRSVHTPPDTNPLPPTRVWNGLHFTTYEQTNIDIVSTAFQITLGLYHPDNVGLTATAKWSLDLSSDISSLWSSDRPTAARRAYRRAVAAATEAWLWTGWGNHLLAAHPNVILGWADPSDPVRPFDATDNRAGGPSINFLLEVAWNMERVVQVLSGYLKFGTVREYVAMRERVMEN